MASSSFDQLSCINSSFISFQLTNTTMKVQLNLQLNASLSMPSSPLGQPHSAINAFPVEFLREVWESYSNGLCNLRLPHPKRANIHAKAQIGHTSCKCNRVGILNWSIRWVVPSRLERNLVTDDGNTETTLTSPSHRALPGEIIIAIHICPSGNPYWFWGLYLCV